jgi:hypothetical protein
MAAMIMKVIMTANDDKELNPDVIGVYLTARLQGGAPVRMCILGRA